MHFTADREGKITKEDSRQDRILAGLYQNMAGRILLRPLVSPAVSKFAGKILDSGASRILIPSFIRSQSIDMSDYERRRYVSFNDFFKRKLVFGARKIEKSPDAFICPCDSRLGVYKINDSGAFLIKHTRYTVKSLLANQKLAKLYDGGYLWVFRLCVADYHRYIYIDEGITSGIIHIPGVFHTVNPIAGDVFPIYKKNTREYCLLRSKHFGTVLQMEVGAMLVGKIENRPGGRKVCRGEEKGNFAYGGSTIILMTQAGKVRPDADILENSQRGIETKVRLGEQVGVKS